MAPLFAGRLPETKEALCSAGSKEANLLVCLENNVLIATCIQLTYTPSIQMYSSSDYNHRQFSNYMNCSILDV